MKLFQAYRTFCISETCYRYKPMLSNENKLIAESLIELTEQNRFIFLYLRNVKGHIWNHKRVYRIYCELSLNLRIKPHNV